MALSGKSWNDKLENYADGYVLKVVGSTATAILANSYTQPAVIYGLSISVSEAGTTGLVDIRDSSATGDNDPTVWSVAISSGTVTFPPYAMQFPRGLSCSAGIVVTATTVTGSISILYKARYPQSA